MQFKFKTIVLGSKCYVEAGTVLKVLNEVCKKFKLCQEDKDNIAKFEEYIKKEEGDYERKFKSHFN